MSTPAQISKAALLELFAGVRMAILHGHFTEALAHKMAEETGTTVAARARSGKSFTFQGNDGDQVGLSLVMLADALDNETDNRNIRGNYFLLLRRQVVCTGTELILDYCEKSKQTAKLAHATWWNFARLFRHTFSHGDGSSAPRVAEEVPRQRDHRSDLEQA